jgi:hypothetical protein
MLAVSTVLSGLRVAVAMRFVQNPWIGYPSTLRRTPAASSIPTGMLWNRDGSDSRNNRWEKPNDTVNS